MAEVTHIVILGGGFGGVYAAMELEKLVKTRSDIRITLISQENFMLFTPMLHEVAAGDLSPENIVNPIRKMLRHTRFIEAEACRIDLAAKRVDLERGLMRLPHSIAYDHLILASGSESNFFDMQGVADAALTMKTLGDATLLHSRMLAVLEFASETTDAFLRKQLLTICIAGGGFAGVETIGAVNDFMREALVYYPEIQEKELRIVLIHPKDVILPELGEKLGRYAQQKLIDRGVEIVTNARVSDYKDNTVSLSHGDPIPCFTLRWTAGVKPGPLIEQLEVAKEKGRITVDSCLRVPGQDNLWAVGDCASVPDWKSGKPQPPTAQHGLRQAVHAAKNIRALIEGREPTPFKFTTIGQLASIGSHVGVANIMGVNFSGFIAWFLWRSVYLMKLPRLVKKIRVATDWTLELIFSKDFDQLLSARDVRAIARIADRIKPQQDDAPAEPEKALAQ
ncbi:MAG: NAD(P)/FAD-dependent oxidoreductase [Tepidisphaeraceae bacterium]